MKVKKKQKAKVDERTKARFGLQAKIMLLVMVPLLVLGATLLLGSIYNQQVTLVENNQEGLKSTVISFERTLDSIAQGSYSVNSEGKLCKGDKVIAESTMLQEIKKETGIDITVFRKDSRILTSIKDDKGELAIGTKASPEVVEKVIKNGQEFYSMNVSVNDKPYFGYYRPLKSNGKIFGMLFAGKPSDEAISELVKDTVVVVVFTIILIVVILIFALFMIRKVSIAILDAKDVVAGVSQGDLTVNIPEKKLKRGDEIGEMLRMVDQLSISLHTIIGDVKATSEIIHTHGIELEKMATQTRDTSEEINRAVEGISTGASSQAEDTSRATNNVVHIGEMIEQIATNVESLDTSSDDMMRADAVSEKMVVELSESNDRTIEAIETISNHVYETNNSVQSIHEAVALISSIAEQTNLLSLNASIEAARAGEHGKGFAVVASEIQKLAEQSNDSAHVIQEIIDQLLEASESTVAIMEDAKGVISDQQRRLEATKNSLSDVTKGINESKHGIVDIRNEIEVLKQERNNIVDVIQNLSAISEENAASTEETTASMTELSHTVAAVSEAAVELKKLSNTLAEAMEFFKL